MQHELALVLMRRERATEPLPSIPKLQSIETVLLSRQSGNHVVQLVRGWIQPSG